MCIVTVARGGCVVIEAAKLAIVIALLGTAVVYGTDVFCALVQRPAVADRRMPVPGVIGIAGAVLGAGLAAGASQRLEAIAAATAVALLLIWLALYLRISAPINRQLTAAATTGDTLVNARALQQGWDRIINARAIIQGAAVAALCVALAV